MDVCKVIPMSWLRLGTPLVICGAGPIGLVTLLAAHAAGAAPIVITDSDENRLAKAKSLVPRVRTVLVERGVDAVNLGKKTVPFMHLSSKEIDLRFQYRYHDTYPKAISLVDEGLINLKPFVTHRFKPEDGVEAFAVASNPAARAIKVQIIGDHSLSATMRSPIFLRLAFGLLTASFAIASPCKPTSVATTSAGSSTISTETSSVTSVASSTADESATTSVLSEPSSGTYPSSSAEVSASVTSQISVTTAESSTIEWTTAESTTTTAAASTTETNPEPTFSLFETGQGPVEEDGLHTYDNDGSVAVFDPNPIFGDASVRPYTIDSQGRLVNDQGFFLCGYYIATNANLHSPASVGTCTSSGPKKAFLHCQLSADHTISCSVPGRSCVSNPNGEPLCEETIEPWSVWSVGTVVVGYGLFIGPSDTPDSFDRIGLRAEEA
ncbi:l-arabinitol 4-dehydrogenase [Fusarium mundagurra]|uniref:L-arabinitol 4-dehydrogenase n=1 Tax=Fusarium mundagurra TaxID=1567541 RepID=A0A8H5Z3U9_9HYPO|nr:l-arabinitol 4-dehydrogenase [Fusarium mundagurra]